MIKRFSGSTQHRSYASRGYILFRQYNNVLAVGKTKHRSACAPQHHRCHCCCILHSINRQCGWDLARHHRSRWYNIQRILHLQYETQTLWIAQHTPVLNSMLYFAFPHFIRVAQVNGKRRKMRGKINKLISKQTDQLIKNIYANYEQQKSINHWTKKKKNK